jgi:putative membrane protein
VITLAYGTLFSIQNTSPVTLDLLFVALPEHSVALWVILAFVLGGLVGVAVSAVAIIKLRSDLLLLKRRYARTNKELDKFRAAGAKDA